MALVTTFPELNEDDGWVQLTTAAITSFIIVNESKGLVYTQYASAKPAATARGHGHQRGEGLISAVHGLGEVWGRRVKGKGYISLTKQ